MAAKQMNRRDLQEKIVALAWKDDAFRKAFLADPKGEFEKKLGVKLPAGLKMTAIAEDDSHLHFVIPAKPAKAAALSDSDLEKVAGGVDIITTAAIVTAVSGVIGGGGVTVTVAMLQDDWGRK